LKDISSILLIIINVGLDNSHILMRNLHITVQNSSLVKKEYIKSSESYISRKHVSEVQFQAITFGSISKLSEKSPL